MAEHGLASAIKLASNESPFGPLPGVAEAVAAAARPTSTATPTTPPRPSSSASPTTSASSANGWPSDRDRSGCSNSSRSRTSAPATRSCTRGRASSPIRSSPASPVAPSRPCRCDARRFDAEAVVAAIAERTRVVLLANPNNPTSTALRTAELQRIVDAAPDDCLVVVDEAYHEFVTGADVPDAIDLFGDRPNVAVLRTLSKAYGLAGLRVGFLVADPDVVDAVNAVRSRSGSTPPPRPRHLPRSTSAARSPAAAPSS